jgi:predicted membrane GTPase involved in stress response
MSPEGLLADVQQDELAELCPTATRRRKRLLKEGDRRRAARRQEAAAT